MLNSRERVWEAEKTAKNSRSVNKTPCAGVGRGISGKQSPAGCSWAHWHLCSPRGGTEAALTWASLPSIGRALSHQTSMLPPPLTGLLFCCASWRLLSTATPPLVGKNSTFHKRRSTSGSVLLQGHSQVAFSPTCPSLSKRRVTMGPWVLVQIPPWEIWASWAPIPQPRSPLQQTHPAKTEVPVLLPRSYSRFLHTPTATCWEDSALLCPP